MIAVEMKFYCYTPWEVAVINEGLSIIEKARAAQFAQAPQEKLEAALAADIAGDAQAEESVVGTITPQGAVKIETNQWLDPIPAGTTAPAVSETEMAAVVQKSLDTRGLADTRDLLAPITGGKRWRETDPSLWPAIKNVLEAK